MHHRLQTFEVSPLAYAVGTSVGMTEEGLVLGRSILAPIDTSAERGQSPRPRIGESRLHSLLSVAKGHPVPMARVMPPIEAAATYWARGDKALANLRLAFADLPRLHDPADAARVALAEHLLDAGMSPGALMTELWPDQFAKHNFNPDQPRVPAGSDGAGQWTLGSGASSLRTQPIILAGKVPPLDEDQKTFDERRRTGQTTYEENAAEGRPIEPTGPLPPGVGPGPYAGTPVPAGPTAQASPSKRLEVDANGKKDGCHTCGTKDPGTKSGMFIPDHQDPTAINPPGRPQFYYPHCARCSAVQGGLIRQYKRRKANE